eukprot:Tbor_TRINITY_DN5501_c9_g1::TRINITY_DN5501_c9_g1_i1::g.13559::m.13559/K09458/fabF; 3-oxoacyl-[acyl-carrier-protein] synthase II
MGGFGPLPQVPRRRVCVTGIGAVSPLGPTVPLLWRALLNSEVATRPLKDTPHYFPNCILSNKSLSDDMKEEKCRSILSAIPCTVAAPVMPLLDEKGLDIFAPTSREPRSFRFAREAVNEALVSATLRTSLSSADQGSSEANNNNDEAVKTSSAMLKEIYGENRIGISIGCGMSGLQDICDVSYGLYSDISTVNYRQVSPFFIPKILANMVAGQVGITHGFRGPLSSSVTACATGAGNIGEAARWISRGDADAAVCGATEACITPVGMAGFARMHALSTKYNGDPSRASRPFNRDRAGFVMGEGAGIVVLEEMDAAVRRGASILAELRGYGTSSDGHHISSPSPDGEGAERCVIAALRDGGLVPSDICYVNAHATGTPVGDEVELSALTRILTGGSAPTLVSSSKGAIGHLLGGAGSVEAIVTIMALVDGIAPPNVNLDNPIEHDRSVVVLPTDPTPMKCDGKACLSTSFGFGGVNAALLFTKV